MTKSSKVGLERMAYALVYTWRGFSAAWRNEEAFRQEALACVVLVPTAFWVGETSVERALMIGSLLLVLVMELVNSAIEAVVDRIGPEHHELSGRAKDIASATVFVTLVNVAVVWFLILFD